MKKPTEIELEYYLGKAVALEGVPAELLKRAGEAFATGLDDRAKWLRELACEFKTKAAEARAHYHSLGGTKGK